MVHNMTIKFIIVFILLNIASLTISVPGTPTTTENFLSLVYIEKEVDPSECHDICGCDPVYMYDETSKECILNLNYLTEAFAQVRVEKSGRKYEAADHDMANDDGMANTLRIEAEHIFRGIIISVIIFMACASVCVVTACIYCCHINYSDRQLKNNVKDIAKKAKKRYSTKRPDRKTRTESIQESCNVVVGDAGVFVV